MDRLNKLMWSVRFWIATKCYPAFLEQLVTYRRSVSLDPELTHFLMTAFDVEFEKKRGPNRDEYTCGWRIGNDRYIGPRWYITDELRADGHVDIGELMIQQRVKCIDSFLKTLHEKLTMPLMYRG